MSAEKVRNTIFFVLIVGLAALAFLGHVDFMLFSALGIFCAVLGVALIVMTVKVKEPRIQNVFFILTGASAVGPICAIQHNLGVFQKLWGNQGISDEPIFFALAMLFFPVLFVIATTGSIICLTRKTGGVK
jgi:hypothetical protein